MRQPPWKCRKCGEKRVKPIIVDYSTDVEHDGRSYSIVVPKLEVLECELCHNRNLPDASFEKVMDALRQKAELLAPAEIRGSREQLHLTQKQLANYLRVAEETVSRWEKGRQIQQRAMDLLLRLFFDMLEVRQKLAGADKDYSVLDARTPLRCLPGSANGILATLDRKKTGHDDADGRKQPVPELFRQW